MGGSTLIEKEYISKRAFIVLQLLSLQSILKYLVAYFRRASNVLCFSGCLTLLPVCKTTPLRLHALKRHVYYCL